VTRGWRRLHNEELHNLQASPNVIRLIKLRKVRVACIGEMRYTYKFVVGKAEGKRPLEGPSHR
jgi:hypothetical protein